MNTLPALPHPDADQITLPNVLAALGDATRLAIIGQLSRCEGIGMTCGQFTDLASKTSITYHVSKLREAGVVNVTPEGTRRRVTLRRDDLDHRFPGFLDSIIASTADLSIEGFEDQPNEPADLSRRDP
ncbi:ArsR/SmtB family transcription factor [Devosia sp. A16]|uniref:ArsR/SmtB family transcription factor n=1 Tax=Devosia sp. A16 TaxID=1736675 RepID=UPI0006D7966F|nr:helix-turn-helix transcriptional regulator [Devosia sp. A16]